MCENCGCGHEHGNESTQITISVIRPTEKKNIEENASRATATGDTTPENK